MRRGILSKITFALLLVMAPLTATSPALACPDGHYESCINVGGLNIIKQCVCLPNSGTVINAATRPITETLATSAGAALEQWIIGSHNTSINGAQPIPFQIRQALTGYIEEDILNRVRFRVGDAGTFNVAGLLLQYGGVNGDVAAVTLIDVIVFKNANDAFNNPKLWAHELTHVKQFRDGGTNSFAVRYARNWHDIEDPAYAAENNFVVWRQTHFQQVSLPVPTGSPPVGPQQFPPFPLTVPGPIPFGSFCWTPAGRFGPGPPQPLGNLCSVYGPFGQIFGQVTL